jgi:hypothetical protein
LGDGGGEVDVILLAGLAVDELDFGWESHAGNLVIQLDKSPAKSND